MKYHLLQANEQSIASPGRSSKGVNIFILIVLVTTMITPERLFINKATMDPMFGI
jgi:hypothetical protein